MKTLLIIAALLLMPTPAWAQPASVTLTAGPVDDLGAVFTLTWPGGAFPWIAGYGDGSGVQRSAGAVLPPITITMTYHASGLATSGWFCATNAAVTVYTCAPMPVPAKPVGPPPVTTTHTLEYVEPSTNACTPANATVCLTCNPTRVPVGTQFVDCLGQPSPVQITTNCPTTPVPAVLVCTPVLDDLKEIRAYWRVDAGPESVATFPASSVAGGAAMTRMLTVPAASGTLTVAVTATDLTGNESVRTATVSKVIDGAVPLSAGPGTLTITP